MKFHIQYAYTKYIAHLVARSNSIIFAGVVTNKLQKKINFDKSDYFLRNSH